VLSPKSPAIDGVPPSGIDGIAVDFNGHPRLVGPAYDMGACEAQRPERGK